MFLDPSQTVDTRDPNSRGQRLLEVYHITLTPFATELKFSGILQDLVDKYTRWFKNPEVTKYLSRTPKDVKQWLLDCASTNWYWFIRRGDPWAQHYLPIIGHVGWKNIDYAKKTAERAIVIGEPRCWGLGVARRCIDLATQSSFIPPGIETIIVRIHPDNPGRRPYLDRESKTAPVLESSGVLRYEFPVVEHLRHLEWFGKGETQILDAGYRPGPDIKPQPGSRL